MQIKDSTNSGKLASMPHQPTGNPGANPQYLLFFDGDCALCNHSVQFILKHEKEPLLYFSPLGGETSKKYLGENAGEGKPKDSMVFFSRGKIFRESEAALAVCRHLKGIFMLFRMGYLIPGFLRNPIYRFVARNRYKWFGSVSYCGVMEAKNKHRFLP